jgi:hypothetical protein
MNLFFSYVLKEWTFDPPWNYKKWSDPLGRGNSQSCLHWCWDTLYQIGDLVQLWSLVPKIPKFWWVLKIQCTVPCNKDKNYPTSPFKQMPISPFTITILCDTQSTLYSCVIFINHAKFHSSKIRNSICNEFFN